MKFTLKNDILTDFNTIFFLYEEKRKFSKVSKVAYSGGAAIPINIFFFQEKIELQSVTNLCKI